MTDPYEILGLPPTATHADVRDAARRMAVLHHPDRGGDPTVFADVTQARDELLLQPDQPAHEAPPGPADRADPWWFVHAAPSTAGPAPTPAEAPSRRRPVPLVGVAAALGLLVATWAAGADLPTTAAAAVVVVAAGFAVGPPSVRAAGAAGVVAASAATIFVAPLWAGLVVGIITLGWLLGQGPGRLSAWAGPIMPT